MASSSTDGRNKDKQMTKFKFTNSRRTAPARALLLLGAGVALAACQHGSPVTTGIVETAPADYRQRHPIAIKEGDRTVELFVGRARGGLSPAQRADVAAFAHAWRREATGGVIIDVPAGTENTHAAHEALSDVRSILAASGVPEGAIVSRPYRPADPRVMATLRLNYPKMTASAGPCGLWPDDIGPASGRRYIQNDSYHNYGCANQRNLAAMVDNPADLVQPRGETPTLAGRRSIVLDKYRKGESTAAATDSGKGKISEVGQ
jgi:pilus assembly protein CpaD